LFQNFAKMSRKPEMMRELIDGSDKKWRR
jgi:hypothetical protein